MTVYLMRVRPSYQQQLFFHVGQLMYDSLLLPWSAHPSAAETLYRSSGLVKTKGTIFVLPPPTDILRSTFNAPPRPQTRMSSGAVALCKHFERGGASSERGKPHPFWTLPTGSNEEKTAAAASILERMLEDARWRNMMMLHMGIVVYEVRNGKGYGMRWTLELEKSIENGHSTRGAEQAPEDWQIKSITFRGFLEPIVGIDHEAENDYD